MNELEALARQVGQSLTKKKLFLTLAESCTGGLLAAVSTDIAGSSQWFERGFVTYSNLAKQEMLGVPVEVLNEHGSVSEQVAVHMATGALNNSEAQVAIAVTGIAGPDGGSEDKPVGTVWIAWAIEDQVTAKKFLFKGDRKAVREQTAREALQGLLDLLDA
jgi:nicotinamide-nucleotide amidase